MDSRAKQRLTGAVILVALMVLLVPELLTGPRVDDAQSADDEGLRRYTIDLEAPATRAAPTQPPSDQTVALPVAAAPSAAPAAQAPVASPSTAPSSTAAPSTAARSTSAASTSAAPVPSPAQTASPTISPASPRPQTTAPPVRPASVEAGSFAVQLGSFGSRDNAERLVRDMKAKGFAAFVAPIKSGSRDLYRVRVGPARDRAAAEALAAQLGRIGQSGSIVPIS